MKGGDLVKFKGSDLVIGVIVDDDVGAAIPLDVLYDEARMGIVWLNSTWHRNVTFQPVSHLEVISEAS